MQIAKDSILMTLSSRLAALDATRLTTIAGVLRTGVAAIENERPGVDHDAPGVFFLRWGRSRAIELDAQSAREMELEVFYYVNGSDNEGACDRGRQLGAMDELLGQMLWPRSTAMIDYAQTPPAAIGGVAMWSSPTFEPAESMGSSLRRTAKIKVYYHAEARA